MADSQWDVSKEPVESLWGVGSGPRDGVPLTVVATSGDEVVLEDPEGVNFTIPRSWLHAELNPEKQFEFSHNAIVNAPPGQLEKVWKDATIADATDPVKQAYVKSQGAPGYPEGIKPEDVKSPLDRWMDEQVGFGGDPVWSNTNPAEASQRPAQNAWAPKYREPKLRNVNLEIPPDDHRFGAWDEDWDPKTKKWVKRKDL